jgi:hypothetical protein
MATILNLCTDEIFNGQEDFVTENAGLLIGDKGSSNYTVFLCAG